MINLGKTIKVGTVDEIPWKIFYFRIFHIVLSSSFSRPMRDGLTDVYTVEAEVEDKTKN